MMWNNARVPSWALCEFYSKMENAVFFDFGYVVTFEYCDA